MATKQSKMDKAREIYAANRKLPTAELTKLIKQKCKLSVFGARTYSYNVRNENKSAKKSVKTKAKSAPRKRAPKAPAEQAAA